MKMEEDADHWERVFHNTVREYVIFLLLLILLYSLSYALISAFRKKTEEFYAGDYEDAVVYRISFSLLVVLPFWCHIWLRLWMCTFSLGISIGAALLLPISIISNEVLLFYPNSYYVQWLNSSLIQGLWNLVFLFSNVGLFVLLPFAFFFTESEGFPGSRKGIMARVYETFAVLALMALITLGMTYILSALFDYGRYNIESLFNVWNYYLPFLYSCVSFLGVLMLLLCTPVGFARLFTVVGELVVKPKFLRDIQEEYYIAMYEEANLMRKLGVTDNDKELKHTVNGSVHLKHQLHQVRKSLNELEKQVKVSPVRRNVVYPIVMLLLLILTIISALMVAQNTLELCFGIKALPLYSQQFSLGISSLSALGPAGAFLEIILILYLWGASVVGLYTLPIFCRLRPKLKDTSMTQVIGNCAVLLILSSALPVLARTLGITNFDLLGDFGRIDWLGSFYIVLFYNIVFAGATALCLGTKITAAVRQELYLRLCSLAGWTYSRDQRSCSFNGNIFLHKDE